MRRDAHLAEVSPSLQVGEVRRDAHLAEVHLSSLTDALESGSLQSKSFLGEVKVAPVTCLEFRHTGRP